MKMKQINLQDQRRLSKRQIKFLSKAVGMIWPFSLVSQPSHLTIIQQISSATTTTTTTIILVVVVVGSNNNSININININIISIIDHYRSTWIIHSTMTEPLSNYP